MDIASASHKPGKADFEGLVTYILVVFFVFIFATVFVRPEIVWVLLWAMLSAMLVPTFVFLYRAWKQHRESINDAA